MSIEGVEINKDEFVFNAPFTAMEIANRESLVGFLSECIELKRRRQKELGGFTVSMPCGSERTFSAESEIPFEDLPCPCGRDDHFLIAYAK